mmetsp:Transcript_8026/g.20083  ORF Transcript_8026/g.20083 Transcript_8026/m.20083 type:complete len:305 (+) Transcript_8026:285-1199(+)
MVPMPKVLGEERTCCFRNTLLRVRKPAMILPGRGKRCSEIALPTAPIFLMRLAVRHSLREERNGRGSDRWWGDWVTRWREWVRAKVVWMWRTRHGLRRPVKLLKHGRIVSGTLWFLLLWHCTRCSHIGHPIHSGSDSLLFPFGRELPLNSGIPMVLHIIVGSSRQKLGNGGPFVSILFMECNQNCLFLFRPLALFPLGIQMSHKAFTALPSLTPREMSRNESPLSSIELTFLFKDGVFLGCPKTLALCDWKIGNQLPLAEAINLIVLSKVGCYLVPFWSRIFVSFNNLLQQIHLLLSPSIRRLE